MLPGTRRPLIVTAGNAAPLSGLVLHPSVRPGAPFMDGAGALDMSTGPKEDAAPDSFLAHRKPRRHRRWSQE